MDAQQPTTLRAWLARYLATVEPSAEEPWRQDFGPDILGQERSIRLARYLAAHGEWFDPAPLDPKLPAGEPGACFSNSRSLLAMAAVYQKRPMWNLLDYVEGLCDNRKGVVLHAWNADPGEPQVYDSTYGIADEWEEPSRFHHYMGTDQCAYVGVRFPQEFVFAVDAIGTMARRPYWPSLWGLEAPLDVLTALEADAGANPRLALLRLVRPVLVDHTLVAARTRGLGAVRRALQGVDRAIQRLEKAAA